MSPFFSILIPTFNRASLLMNAIESVLAQTYTDFELIVIDDGSTDDTKDVVATFEDRRLIYRFQQNKELSGARNTGVSVSQGQFVCFLDDDDSFIENHLENLKEAIDTSTKSNAIFRTGLLIRNNSAERKGVEWQGKSHALTFVWHQFVGITTFAFPKNIFDSYLFPEKYILFEDKHFLARVLLDYELVQILNSSTVVYNIYDQSRSYTAYKDEKRLQNQVDCLEDLFDLKGNELIAILGPKAKAHKLSDFYYQAAQQALRTGDRKFVFKRLREAEKYNGSLIRRLKYLKVRLKALRG